MTHTFPHPLDEGTRVLIYNLLKHLSKRNETHLLCLNDRPVAPADLEAVRSLGVRSIEAIGHEVPRGFARRLGNVALDCVPFCVRQFESDRLREALRNFLKKQPVDVVHAEYISSAVYRGEFEKIPAVFYPHDAVSMLFARNAGAEPDPLRKFYTWSQQRKVVRFEKEMLSRFQQTVVVSQADKDYLARHADTSRVNVIAVGIDCDFFAPRGAESPEPVILFRGVMNFLPNDDAARYFYEDVFRLVKREVPNAKFQVVGKDPSDALRNAAQKDSSLTLSGFVDDIREPMAQASVIVTPMRIGSGIKIKILESLAMAKPVVATTLACSGLETVPGKHLLVGDTPQTLADAVVKLLKDAALRKTLGEEGLKLVKERYPWEAIAQRFEEVYRKAVAG